MPTPGLSLVGFFGGQQEAVGHLTVACVPPTNSNPVADWQAAKAALGAPFPNAGNPNIMSIPAAHQGYLQQMRQDIWTNAALQAVPGASVELVEVDPLLAFQFLVDTDRSRHHCGNLSNPPDLAELFPICLPIGEPREPFQWSVSPQKTALIVKSRSLNLRMTNINLNSTQAMVHMTFQFSFPPTFIQVARLNGRCFLFNGYHRVYGARMAGHTHIPCVVRDVPDYESAGVRSDGSTFPPAAFQAAEVPTIGHFTNGRAHPVQIRSVSRALTLSWAEHATPDE